MRKIEAVMYPYDWMPSYGESFVWMSTGPNREVAIDIDYDSPEDRNTLLSRRILFGGVIDFRSSISYHQPERLGCKDIDGLTKSAVKNSENTESYKFGSLCILHGSSLVSSWGAMKGMGGCNHYFMNFLAAKSIYDIVAGTWSLGEEVVVPSDKGRRLHPPMPWTSG